MSKAKALPPTIRAAIARGREKEAAELEKLNARLAQLEVDFRQVEIEKNKALKAIQEFDAWLSDITEVLPLSTAEQQPLNPKRADRLETKKIINAVRATIQQKGTPLHTKEILEALRETHNLKIATAHPVTRMSQMLSRSPEFKNDRLHGWSLLSQSHNSESPVGAGLSISNQASVTAAPNQSD